MKTKKREGRSSIHHWIGRSLWVGGSFLVFVLLFFDPLEIHPIDGWLQARLGYHTGDMERAPD